MRNTRICFARFNSLNILLVDPSHSIDNCARRQDHSAFLRQRPDKPSPLKPFRIQT
jgi:hypothetical protein